MNHQAETGNRPIGSDGSEHDEGGPGHAHEPDRVRALSTLGGRVKHERCYAIECRARRQIEDGRDLGWTFIAPADEPEEVRQARFSRIRRAAEENCECCGRARENGSAWCDSCVIGGCPVGECAGALTGDGITYASWDRANVDGETSRDDESSSAENA